MNNNYYRWLYGDCGCGCNNGYKKIEDCSCEQILLDISNIHTDINVLQTEIDNIDINLEDYYTKDQIDALIPTNVSELVNDAGYITNAALVDYATKQWVENKNYLTNADMSDYALKSEIPVVPTNVSSFINDAGYLTDVDLSDYALKSDIPTSNSAFTNDAGYLTDVDLSNYALKSEIPVVPTSNSAFTNDMHYLTSADTANYITSAATQTMINNAFYCCSEAEWQQISGNPQNNVLYLIY